MTLLPVTSELSEPLLFDTSALIRYFVQNEVVDLYEPTRLSKMSPLLLQQLSQSNSRCTLDVVLMELHVLSKQKKLKCEKRGSGILCVGVQQWFELAVSAGFFVHPTGVRWQRGQHIQHVGLHTRDYADNEIIRHGQNLRIRHRFVTSDKKWHECSSVPTVW
eukprot:CAMPEP_0202907322 /NCGR_PEP_ID=MMETSP1392-20130828/42135_1 /ASSEMBLY_ACC=CAM_ASM_000868 /TAXON_ID=225041 /ORGANISM="Chlamydomonas chlamydogama, Strain SAG 11-48b" /LENGTH=161 /DNA_ID=CAMNT_0049596159 /DNA_START=246 /DNA_END=728 /DNA_ORIENTATION=+